MFQWLLWRLSSLFWLSCCWHSPNHVDISLNGSEDPRNNKNTTDLTPSINRHCEEQRRWCSYHHFYYHRSVVNLIQSSGGILQRPQNRYYYQYWNHHDFEMFRCNIFLRYHLHQHRHSNRQLYAFVAAWWWARRPMIRPMTAAAVIYNHNNGSNDFIKLSMSWK